MAQLHYQNLGVRRPDVLMQRAFYGLKTFYDFLQRTRSYTESDAAVKRLSWRPGPGPDDDEDDPPVEGYWVELVEPEDRPNEPESTFRDFLDENVSEVYEAEGAPVQGTQRRPARHDFRRDRRIAVLDRDPDTQQLLLGRKPSQPALLLRPNTWPLVCQIRALQALQNAPRKAHLPLLRLFESVGHVRWPNVWSAELDPDDWMVLTDADRPGTLEQRQFVEISLSTPDFAFLEGPPGSGKTTAICELILQLAREGKRVLLCASTHVAVDNVLERLMDTRNPHRDLVIPVRIGDRRNVSEQARPWQLERFVRTERERLLRELRGLRTLSASQRELHTVLKHGSSVVERLVLDAANLVCGTTIGILQHPDIKKNGSGAPVFDVLIVDEASKTTFQEFLVPALLAKRWVIVGDPKQLSPYVDDTAMAINVATCLPSSELRAACVDTFFAGHHSRRRRRTTVAAVTHDSLDAYRAQAEARGVELATPADGALRLASASLVVGTVEQLEAHVEHMPLDTAVVRGPPDKLRALRRRVAAWNRLQRRRGEEAPSWEGEIGWRLARLYEQRFADADDAHGRTTPQRLRAQVDDLLPDAEIVTDPEAVWGEIDRVRRVALPSVLESLRYGFERDPRQRQGTALSDGLPSAVLRDRHTLLSTQHRMHGDIAAFSHQHIYDGEALWTPPYLEAKRQWSYARYARRALWLDVRGRFKKKYNTNPREAEVLVTELRAFDAWAQRHYREDGHPWEVAVLTFYRGQEREVRQHLRRWTRNHRAMRNFQRGPKGAPYLKIELCTVDRFQGHEADIVFISVACPHPTSFLESPNRLNVALTRARFQRVVIGNRTGMFDARAASAGDPQRSALATFAANEAWESTEVQS